MQVEVQMHVDIILQTSGLHTLTTYSNIAGEGYKEGDLLWEDIIKPLGDTEHGGTFSLLQAADH